MAAYPTNAKDSAESPAKSSFSITPHATNEVGDYIPRAIYVGGAGTIAMRLAGDTADITWTGVAAGTVLPVRPRYIRVTGTTCTGIIGLY
jgi:hypothetical protein